METLLISIGMLVICIVLLLGVLVLWLGPTRGDGIKKYSNPQKALFVIDVQEDYTGVTAKSPFPYKNSEKLIASVNRVIEKASERDWVIVYIRQEFEGFLGVMVSRIFGKGTAVKGSPGTDIDRRISIVNGNIFPKPKGDAFSNPELGRFLIGHKVDEVFLTGLDAEFCVYQTARGALNREYKVNIIKDAIALRAGKKWDALMRKYERNGVILKDSVQFTDFP